MNHQSSYEYPFAGFRCVPSIADDILTFGFPEGYAPNGDCTPEVAYALLDMLGSEIVSVSKHAVSVRLDAQKLLTAIMEWYDDNEYRATIPEEVKRGTKP